LETTCDCAALDAILEKHADEPSGLIPVLQDVQEHYGYLPEDILERVSRSRGVPFSEVFGVATFYAQFRLEPQGDTVIRVCHGTACHVNGAPQLDEVLQDELGLGVGQTSEDRRFSLESVACLGCCGLAPVVVVGDKTYGRLHKDRMAEIATELRDGSTPPEEAEAEAVS